MKHLVAMFEQAARKMIGMNRYHSDVRRLLELIKRVAKNQRLEKGDLRADVRTHAFLLVAKLNTNRDRDLITPYLIDLGNASNPGGQSFRICNELLPVVERLTSDPFAKKDSQHPSWMPKALSPQDANL